ncbi:MAG: phenylalanine--tRNA ligase beta subunit-related protein [Candidatus Peribacteraceae bacterium]|nr:phenylalanine--tRNA ligase beta subunit-related protein [Candidatus Peribacteraceae bacterium]MDD5742828.1 phenylalanine--tRNA ligase beta subunit-related protein [Candidatus Peribacteraceae bacterium]
MQFSVSPSVSDLLPALRVGILLVHGAENKKAHPEVAQLLRDSENGLRSRYTDETFKDAPHIVQFFAAHRAFGCNPKRYYPSHFALAKRVLKGGTLPSINTFVDLYNVLSLRHLLPVGGEDLDRCTGDIVLDRATGTEHFIALGETQNDPPEAGELVYKDQEGVLCRRMNWREADRTKLTQETVNAVLVIESLDSADPLAEILAELQALVMQFCGGTCETFLLDREHASREP